MGRATPLSIIFVIAGALTGATLCSAAAGALNRDADPVTLVGSQIPTLDGRAPERIVGFRYTPGWSQIPVQVDERAFKDYGEIYGLPTLGFDELNYTDAGTFMGPDPNPLLDIDDEIVFMAKDAGTRASANVAAPAGVLPGSRVEVEVSDPLGGERAYVYLFESDGSLVADAGADYVDYDFRLLSGPYLTTYNTVNGPNPENSEIVTAFYRTHFSDRWIRDALNIYTTAAGGDDILDRHKNLFDPDDCSRNESSFSDGEGAFVVNKDGPVRAIRSYIGSESGPLTKREHFFYERRHDIRTFLRVHPIPGMMDFYDYNSAASGMRYRNNINTAATRVDGSPLGDDIGRGAISWEMVTGEKGTVIHTHSIATDIGGFGHTTYYLDDATPPVPQCTGDQSAYGSSGPWADQFIPNTDPLLEFILGRKTLTYTRIVYYEKPNPPVQTAERRSDQATHPLVATVGAPTSVGWSSAPAYRLDQNSPNPFRRTTRIAFSAPPGVPMALRIYDVRGRLVRTVHEGRNGSGVATWDGTDPTGHRVSSGVYFYRFESPHRTMTRKLVIVE